MSVLKAIGAFFAKIGRWIKDTAWVQPLLIVGGIFAVIFCIKPLSDWFGSMFQGGVASEDYYKIHQLSLKNAETGESEFDDLINYMDANSKKAAKKDYGDKFFVSFVSKGCDNCDACYPGFKLLEENFNTGAFKIDSGKEGNKGFQLYTVYIDERNDDDELLFDDLLRNHSNYFEELFGRINEGVDSEDYYYYVNTKDKTTFKSNVKSFFDCINADEDEDDVSCPTPTTLLFDKTDAGVAEEMYQHVSEIFFNYTIDVENTSDNYNKGYFLADAWNYKGNFTKKD